MVSTKGLKPGDRRYNADKNEWEVKEKKTKPTPASNTRKKAKKASETKEAPKPKAKPKAKAKPAPKKVAPVPKPRSARPQTVKESPVPKGNNPSPGSKKPPVKGLKVPTGPTNTLKGKIKQKNKVFPVEPSKNVEWDGKKYKYVNKSNTAGVRVMRKEWSK